MGIQIVFLNKKSNIIQKEQIKKYLIGKLKDLSRKNKVTKEYSLGDVLLMNQHETMLIKNHSLNENDLKQYSPNFYNLSACCGQEINDSEGSANYENCTSCGEGC